MVGSQKTSKQITNGWQKEFYKSNISISLPFPHSDAGSVTVSRANVSLRIRCHRDPIVCPSDLGELVGVCEITYIVVLDHLVSILLHLAAEFHLALS